MPIEIRELVIRATVDSASGGGGNGGGNEGCGGASGQASASGTVAGGRGSASAPSDDLVQACVREVMRLLELKAER